MRTYGQYCPIARGAEIFAERWTPLIIRNLQLGCETFGEILEGAPGLSGTLLTQRLKQLERVGIVESAPKAQGRGQRYQLTSSGHDLFKVCETLGEWGARWLEIAPENLDPFVALWSMCNVLRRDRLPDRRVVIRLDFTGFGPHERYWLLLEHGEAEICKTYPGLDEDLYITADAEAFVKWHAGNSPGPRQPATPGSSSTVPHGSCGPSRPGTAAACSLASSPTPALSLRIDALTGATERLPCWRDLRHASGSYRAPTPRCHRGRTVRRESAAVSLRTRRSWCSGVARTPNRAHSISHARSGEMVPDRQFRSRCERVLDLNDD